VLASVAASRTATLSATEDHLTALTGGYHLAFLVGAVFAATGAALSATLLRGAKLPAHEPAGELAGAESH
jgi:NhaP-type Na+/H+ or K+/H+ antiporter